MYEIIFSDNALKQLKKLEKPLQKRIIAVLERIRMRPEQFVKKLVGETAYKVRVGDYRLIVDIAYERKSIYVVLIGHRKNVYDKL